MEWAPLTSLSHSQDSAHLTCGNRSNRFVSTPHHGASVLQGLPPNFQGCPAAGKAHVGSVQGCARLTGPRLAISRTRPGSSTTALTATYPFPPGLLIQGGHPGSLPLVPPAVQRQDPGEQHVRLGALLLARLGRPPPGPGSRPSQRPLRQVQAHRAKGHDEERHQDQPLDLTEPRAQAGHGDGAYPARLAPTSQGSPGGARSPRQRAQDISSRPSGGRGGARRAGSERLAARARARGPRRGGPGGEQEETPAGARRPPPGTAPPTPHTWRCGRGGGRSGLGVGAGPGAAARRVSSCARRPGVQPAAPQWPERLGPGAGRGRVLGGGAWASGAPAVSAPLKALRPGPLVGPTLLAARGSRPSTCARRGSPAMTSRGPRRRGVPTGRARRGFPQRWCAPGVATRQSGARDFPISQPDPRATVGLAGSASLCECACVCTPLCACACGSVISRITIHPPERRCLGFTYLESP